MTGNSILPRFGALANWFEQQRPARRPDIHALWLDRSKLPRFVAESPGAMRLLELLGPLHWSGFPERDLVRNWGQTTVPHAAFIAAYLVKVNEGLTSMGALRHYLLEHPAIIWLCGFPLVASGREPPGFDAEASLPTQRHLTHMLRVLPNATLQVILADTVQLIRDELGTIGVATEDTIALDTKHIIAWVKENNGKVALEGRFAKDKQPAGDPDCRLGCKRRHNRQAEQPDVRQRPATPRRSPVAAKGLTVGEFYWGYGSGVVAVPVPGRGEYVLAELTQPFDQSDVSYFFPLMQQVEQRLGHKPRFGAFDAAYDAWYTYAYFYREEDPAAFAAIPFSEKGGYKAKGRQFSPEGLPLCAAGLPMPLKFTYIDRTTTIVEHERGKYVCPLLDPQRNGQTCPVNHKHWPTHGGCTAMMPTSVGARLRYTLDRDSQAYKDLYDQRTAVERINSQAVALGIERPHIRNGAAIGNLNTLTYILINLRFLQRLRQRQTASE